MKIPHASLLLLCRQVTSRSAHIGRTSTFTISTNDSACKILPFIDKMISCILTDMDGTLLNSEHQLTNETVEAVAAALNHGFDFFPCTGRSRSSMATAAGQQFIELFGGSVEKIGGVYLQGLVVFGRSGSVIYERKLDDTVIHEVVKFTERHDVGVVAYCREDIYARKNCAKTVRTADYRDPIPLEHPAGLDKLSEANITVNKLIIMDDEARLVEIRSLLEEALADVASVTKAVPGMLEVLPLGASKGYGVEKLLEHIDAEPHHVIAFGDGENDIEMLQLVKYGIAVKNARDKLKAVAHTVLDATNDEGAVSAVLRTLVQELPRRRIPVK